MTANRKAQVRNVVSVVYLVVTLFPDAIHYREKYIPALKGFISNSASDRWCVSGPFRPYGLDVEKER